MSYTTSAYFRRPRVLAINNMGHADSRVTHVVPHNLRSCAFAPPMVLVHGADATENGFYRSSRQCADLCNGCLRTSAGKVIFGSVRATSATDLPTLACT